MREFINIIVEDAWFHTVQNGTSSMRKISEGTDLFGPIHHRSNGIHSFAEFDIDRASQSAILGPAIYATFGDGSWDANHLKDGRTLTGHVRGKVIDLTDVTANDLEAFSKLVGRTVETLPVLGMEKRYGSVAAALKAAGYAAAIHQGPGSTGKHIAVFDKSSIVESD